MDIIYKYINLFPPLIYSPKYEQIFQSLNKPVSSSKFLTAVLISFLIIAPILFLLEPILVLLLIIIKAITLLYPFLLYKKAIDDIKAELPKFIIDLSSGLVIGLGLIEAIRISLNESKKFSKYFSTYLDRIQHGESINNVLVSFSERFKDKDIQLIIFQLINALHTGSAKELKRLGMQLIKDQMFELKEFGSKLQIIVQFYIVLILLVPIYAFMIIILSLASEQELPDITNLLIFVFPAVLALFIYSINSIFPSNYFIENRIDLLPLLINWVVLIISYYLNIELIELMVFYLIMSFLFIAFNINKFRAQLYLAKLERGMIDVALIMASLPAFNLETLFNRIIKNKIDGWLEIAIKAREMLNNGLSAKEVFTYIYRIPSNYVRLFITNLEYIYYSGVASQERVVEWLESFMSTINLRREIESELNIFKYSIYISLLIIPFIYINLYDFSKKLIDVEIKLLLLIPIIVVGSGISLISSIFRNRFAIIECMALSSLVLIIFNFIF